MILSLVLLSAMLVGGGYADAYPADADYCCRWLNENQSVLPALTDLLDQDRELATCALSVVAPEICQWGTLRASAEIVALRGLYIAAGKGDFSIGPFQMKPSFAEKMEAAHPGLRPPGADSYAVRRERLERLCCWEGQLPYLAAFVRDASEILDSWGVTDSSERLAYMATLYNGGLSITRERADYLLSLKQFPHVGVRKFNYASAALEFYPLVKRIFGE